MLFPLQVNSRHMCELNVHKMKNDSNCLIVKRLFHETHRVRCTATELG